MDDALAGPRRDAQVELDRHSVAGAFLQAVFELVAIGAHEAVQEVGELQLSFRGEPQHVLELGRALDDVSLEIGAPIAEVRDALHVAQPLLAAAQPIEGLVEYARDVADLVGARGSEPDLEIAAAHLLGGPLDLAGSDAGSPAPTTS